jgi:hypothetical protein
MASFDTSGLDDLINEMQRLGQEEGPVVDEMLDAGAAIIRDHWKETATKHGYIDTGAMVDSVDFPVKGNVRALYRDIYPQGKDAKGVRNAQKAFILHYGKHNMPGSYWVDEAETKAGPEVTEACQAIWDRFLKSGGG